jgi:hypothetical protein
VTANVSNIAVKVNFREGIDQRCLEKIRFSRANCVSSKLLYVQRTAYSNSFHPLDKSPTAVESGLDDVYVCALERKNHTVRFICKSFNYCTTAHFVDRKFSQFIYFSIYNEREQNDNALRLC